MTRRSRSFRSGPRHAWKGVRFSTTRSPPAGRRIPSSLNTSSSASPRDRKRPTSRSPPGKRSRPFPPTRRWTPVSRIPSRSRGPTRRSRRGGTSERALRGPPPPGPRPGGRGPPEPLRVEGVDLMQEQSAPPRMINEPDRRGGGQRFEVGLAADPPEAPKERPRAERFPAPEKDLQPPGQLPEEGIRRRRQPSAFPLD